MRWLGRVILGLTVIAIATAVGPTSAAAAGWQPAQNAATTGRDSFARVAVDGQGDAVAVWARFVPLNSWEIVAASRPRGGQWGSYTTLTRGHRTVSLRPKVAVDPNGNAVALWVARPPEGNENVFNSIWASERTPDGQWSEPGPLVHPLFAPTARRLLEPAGRYLGAHPR